MGLSALVIIAVFTAAFLVSVIRGPQWAFVLVFLPAMILLNQLPEILIPHVPISAENASLYAIFFSLPFAKTPVRFRWNLLDTVFALLLVSATITAWTTESFETGINILRTDLLTWLVPYYCARAFFVDWNIRRAALVSLVGVTGVMFVFALLEFRLQPYAYLHFLQMLGMGNYVPVEAYRRYLFFRVAGPLEHPIFFGNMCLVLVGMIAVLAKTSGRKLTDPLVLCGMFMATACLGMSISFTPYLGLIAGVPFLLLLISMPLARRLVPLMTAMIFVGLTAFTYQTASQKLPERPEGELERSLWIRKMIITESWTQAIKAPPFGFGLRADFRGEEGFDLKSVDNTYLQFTMTRGPVYTALWISIGLVFSLRIAKGFRLVRDRSQLFPLAASAATVLALMISMYTVWAGALYTVVWVIMIGLSNTLVDQIVTAAAAPTPVTPMPQGFPVRRVFRNPAPRFAES